MFIIYELLHIDELYYIFFLPLIPFSTITSISMSVNNSNFTSVFFKSSYHASPGAERNFAGSN